MEEIQSFKEVFGVERVLTPAQEHFAQTGEWIPDDQEQSVPELKPTFICSGCRDGWCEGCSAI